MYVIRDKIKYRAKVRTKSQSGNTGFTDGLRCFVETARFLVCPREGQYGIQVPLGAWHSVVVHERSTILEAKDGAYGK